MMKELNKYPILFILFILFAFLLFSCDDNETTPENETPVVESEAIFNEDLSYGTMQDNEGNTYRTIEIGNQTWMAQNLRTTQFRNGDEIPEVTENADWPALTDAAQSSYENNDNEVFLATHGRLYNWFAATDNRNISPEGWHVPTIQEWETLAATLGGAENAGGQIKEIGEARWNAPNTNADNSSGFTALPSGRREYTDGRFINQGFNTFWWTSSPYNPDYSWYYQVNYDIASLNAANFHKQYGFAVRLVKD